MRNAARLFWLLPVLLILAGAVVAVSPFYFPGGVVNLYPAAGDHWVGALINLALSVVLGLGMIVGGVVLALGIGIGVATTGSAGGRNDRRASNGSPGPSAGPPATDDAHAGTDAEVARLRDRIAQLEALKEEDGGSPAAG